ncbi:hypothetical protein CORC01_06241 [Colletotrichum orchidophilum]|uniref:Uncharacterized protein n=1 Tax=Colletotrichum orchidophilum TaxID=1209926 RepID=A0A1G4BAM7_9PEZI|nr:uncharacterized protein CORC01_06241 [Colletotrichum orchidophilum]OHE98450.1 hypothetical protein CORC01_06241 [Colletotrichum orchidophilum]
MKPISVLFLAGLAAAAVTDGGLIATRDEIARDLEAITDSQNLVDRDEQDSSLHPFSIEDRAEEDDESDLTTRDLDEAASLDELVARQANSTGGGDKKNIGEKKENKKDKCEGCTKGKKKGKDANGKVCRCKKKSAAKNGEKKNNGTATDTGKGKNDDGKKKNGKNTKDEKKNNSGKADGNANAGANNKDSSKDGEKKAKANTDTNTGKETDTGNQAGNKNDGTAADGGKNENGATGQ